MATISVPVSDVDESVVDCSSMVDPALLVTLGLDACERRTGFRATMSPGSDSLGWQWALVFMVSL